MEAAAPSILDADIAVCHAPARVLLHVLDTPTVAPQTMAFSVAEGELTELRGALRAIVEDADVAPLHALWERHRATHETEVASRRYRVETSWLRDVFGATTAAAKMVGLDRELPVPAHLRSVGSIDLHPHVWLRLARGSTITEQVRSLIDAAPVIAESRVEALLEALANIDEAPEREPLCAPRDVSWVRSLQFERSSGGRPTSHIVDPARDIVVAPEELGLLDHETPLGALERVRALVRPDVVLELLVGPFVPSDGPGPFLSAPPMARPIEDESWRRLPLFDVIHSNWPLCGGTFLEGDSLGLAASWVESTAPDRAWHAAFNTEEIDEESWADLVATYWPSCKARFLSLLAAAQRDGRAVVLVDNELSHAEWPGTQVLPRPTHAGLRSRTCG